MAASRVVKVEGGENDLLERIAADEAFGVTLEELEKILKPETTQAEQKSRQRTSSTSASSLFLKSTQMLSLTSLKLMFN